METCDFAVAMVHHINECRSHPETTPPEHIVTMYSLWPESFPRWINHDKVCAPHTSFLFISHPARTPSMPLRSYSKDERGAHHHGKCCEIVVSMEMGSNTEDIIIWEASTHRWYLTFINEYNVTCELIKPPRRRIMIDVFFCFEARLSAARLQMTLLGLIYQGMGVVHWVTTWGATKKNCVAPCVSQSFSVWTQSQTPPWAQHQWPVFLSVSRERPADQLQTSASLTHPFPAGPCGVLILCPNTCRSVVVLNDLPVSQQKAWDAAPPTPWLVVTAHPWLPWPIVLF